MRVLRWFDFLVLIVFSYIAGSSNAAELQVEWDKILNGEVVVEPLENRDGIPGLRASFVVTAPGERIWEVLVDYDNFPKIFRGIDEIRVLEQGPMGAQVEFWIDAVFKKYHYVLYRHYEQPGRRLTWKRISGDMKKIEGYWEIQDAPRPGVKLLIYESYVKVGGLIPTGLVRRVAMARAREMGKRLCKWISQGLDPSTPPRTSR